MGDDGNRVSDCSPTEIYTPTKARNESDDSPERPMLPRIRRNSQPAIPTFPAPTITSVPAGVRLSRRGSLPCSRTKKGVLGAAPPGFLPAILSSPLGGYSVFPRDGVATTAMLRNIPARVSATQLKELLDLRGFYGFYDFLYLPLDFETQYSLGYAFINFVSLDYLQRFTLLFHGSSIPFVPSRKFCEVCMAKVQGLEANLRLFSNSLNIGKLPDALKPVIFIGGRYVHIPDSLGNLPVTFE